MMLNILFVDDDSLILAGLKRKFRRFGDEWQMEFVTSGDGALMRMAQRSFDVVVTDLWMAGMDGGELLRRVKVLYPAMIRVILTAQCSQEAVYRTLGPAHQFLSKPCDPVQLRDILHRGIALQKRIVDPKILELVTRIALLPCLPKVFHDVVMEATSARASIDQVGQIITQDPVLNADLMQLVNSSYFAFSQQVTSPTHAASLLGMDMLKSLVLCVGVFNQFKQVTFCGFSLGQVVQHSIEVGQLAKQLAREVVGDEHIAHDAMLAGMLHDVGKLALATCEKIRYDEVLQLAHQNNVTLWHAERAVLGLTHAEVGGYLLNLWGLPQTVVEAVALHHEPSAFGGSRFSALTAVHVANGIVHDRSPKWLQGTAGRIDDQYLASLDLQLEIAKWIAEESRTEAELIEG